MTPRCPIPEVEAPPAADLEGEAPTADPEGAASIEIKVSFLRPLHAERGDVSAVGRALRVGWRVAFAEAHARDGGGELVGHATSSLALVQL